MIFFIKFSSRQNVNLSFLVILFTSPFTNRMVHKMLKKTIMLRLYLLFVLSLQVLRGIIVIMIVVFQILRSRKIGRIYAVVIASEALLLQV